NATTADPTMTPEFPGLTDQRSMSRWDPPFEFNKSWVSELDERFWDEYRAAPKAFLTLAAGQRLWGTRFGSLTSVRLVPPSGDLEAQGKTFAAKLVAKLNAASGELRFDAVRERLLEASRGGNDFGLLFLGFSFFLIAAALLLVGLLFRLNLDRRAS